MPFFAGSIRYICSALTNDSRRYKKGAFFSRRTDKYLFDRHFQVIALRRWVTDRQDRETTMILPQELFFWCTVGKVSVHPRSRNQVSIFLLRNLKTWMPGAFNGNFWRYLLYTAVKKHKPSYVYALRILGCGRKVLHYMNQLVIPESVCF